MNSYALLAKQMIGLSLLMLLILGCQHQTPSNVVRQAPSPDVKIEKLDLEDALPNAIRVTEKVISGGEPHGEAGFQALQNLGVKTVVTVDGAQPDVETAKKYGLRYVHLPHGYDGIENDHGQKLAKAIRDLEGPIYVHCHHGKHRSPAAAAVACVANGWLTAEQGTELLSVAGTSDSYQGLFRSVSETKALTSDQLDQIQVVYVERAEIPPLAEAMVEIGKHFDHLKRFEENQWQTLSDHPDLSPAHEALLLNEQFTEMRRPRLRGDHPAGYHKLTERSQQLAEKIQKRLDAGERFTAAAQSDVSQWLQQLKQDCNQCHRQYRN